MGMGYPAKGRSLESQQVNSQIRMGNSVCKLVVVDGPVRDVYKQWGTMNGEKVKGA